MVPTAVDRKRGGHTDRRRRYGGGGGGVGRRRGEVGNTAAVQTRPCRPQPIPLKMLSTQIFLRLFIIIILQNDTRVVYIYDYGRIIIMIII